MTRIDYATIPPAVREALDNHAQHHRTTGDFTTAVLANDLAQAVGYASPESLAAPPSIIAYVWHELPRECCRSHDRVRAWRAIEAAKQEGYAEGRKDEAEAREVGVAV